MLEYYLWKDNKIVELDEEGFKSSTWIHAINPSLDEINFLSKKLKINPKIMEYSRLKSVGIYNDCMAFPISFINAENSLEHITIMLNKDYMVTISESKLNLADFNYHAPLETKYANINCFFYIIINMLDILNGDINRLSNQIDKSAKLLFNYKNKRPPKMDTLMKTNFHVGNNAKLLALAQDSLNSFRLALDFLKSAISEDLAAKIIITYIEKEVVALMELTNSFMDSSNFLQNAAIGYINLNQNDVISKVGKIALMLAPPTLTLNFYSVVISHFTGPITGFKTLLLCGSMVLSSYIMHLYLRNTKA